VVALTMIGGGALEEQGSDLGGALGTQGHPDTQAHQGAQLRQGTQVHQGTLAPSDSTPPTGEYLDAYEVTWSAGQRVRVELSSQAFDAYLILRYPSGRQRDNDDANGNDAAIEEHLDETGTYRVVVTSFSPGETGPYTLTIR
jgi:hypothetical protein